jgi:hypothetical protein
VIDLYGVALPDAEADRSTDIVEDGPGAWRQIRVAGVEPCSHVAARNIEADAADRDVVLVGDHAADGVSVTNVAVGAQNALDRAADGHATLHLCERLGLMLAVNLDVAHDASCLQLSVVVSVGGFEPPISWFQARQGRPGSPTR